MKVKLYAPKYYCSFRCLADKCKNSCCIGWEIEVDAKTYSKYEGSNLAYTEQILKTVKKGEEFCFAQGVDGRCPHLNSQGLCKIILECGEDYLCDICRLHPRFFNDTLRGREVGLGMSCEAACRLILTSDYRDTCEVGSAFGEASDTVFDAVAEREKIYSILSNSDMPYKERLAAIYSAYGVSPSVLSDGEWRSLLIRLEYLDEKNRRLYANYSSEIDTPSEAETFLERFLAYLIYRHASGAQNEYGFSMSLGFALFSERLLCSLIKEEPYADPFELARVFSSEIEYSEENTECIKNEFL